MKANHAWLAVLGQLQVDMPRSSFDTWVKDAEFVAFEDDTFIIGVNNAYARDWLESRLTSTSIRILTGMMKRSVKLRFVVWQLDAPKEELGQESIEEIELQAPLHIPKNSSLNNKYQFDNFVVAASNRLAHAAALAVAEKPGEAYNPLFLYGPPGYGKTHLMHAIGNKVHKQGQIVTYVSAEEFTNQLIQAIRSRKTEAFRKMFRRLDVLLIDDIQFLLGKEATQEEFFHTFNALHGLNKQLVISSDRAPKEFRKFEDRLRSRFGWGLIADIHKPELETRLAILQSKAKALGRHIEENVLLAIAEKMGSNIRELEGAFIRTLAFADLHGYDLDVNLVDVSLENILPDPPDLEAETIVQLIAESYGISVEQITSKSRSRHIAFPRQVAMFILREEAKLSLPQIGEILGGRDHTTVMYGNQKIANLIANDEESRKQIGALREKLANNSAIVRIY